MTTLLRLTAYSLVVGALAAGPLLLAQQPRPDAVAKQYQTLCASCHGDQLQGNQAPSMLDDTWVSGGDDASLAASGEHVVGLLLTMFPSVQTTFADASTPAAAESA